MLMIDIAGHHLTALDRERLTDPRVGGLILFSRNYDSREQLAALCAEIHALRTPPLLIAVDHEGGRVQRFRTAFTPIPPMAALGTLWDHHPEQACEAARATAYVLAAECRAVGVDFSFTPVLDLNWQRSEVIGNRAFHARADAVIALAKNLIAGLHEAGMASCGKHFPGHGWVCADSHVALPVDERSLEAMTPDMQPYAQLPLDAVMPAHVIYPCLDPHRPAGFSPLWLGKLRQELAFDGVIFSDDLSMAGAQVMGDITARAQAAWDAGCDMLLVCNAPDDVGELLKTWHPTLDEARRLRIARLIPHVPGQSMAQLQGSARWRSAQEMIERIA
jgi:beta-N-acetylhexosaminidase